ncbi:UNVERIFIED_CONTAM: hypothetical protein Sradi_0776900 [Sesamum radiatum]|uniref:RNase H type-1 domain-containing protein n=1 Tax=Sesamum radiatum TaxID=300843 RepID=A0AAW2VPP6_SESRA
METPPENWVKLNIDGSAISNPGQSGSGGIFRNNQGEFITAFSHSIGISTNAAAELRALHIGLSIAKIKHFSRLIIESDSMFVVNLFNRKRVPKHLMLLHKDCQRKLIELDAWQITFVYREANRVADCLAKRAAAMNFFCQENFVTCPPFLSKLVQEDLHQMYLRCTASHLL